MTMNKEIQGTKATCDAAILLESHYQEPAIDRERLFQAVRQSGEAIIITDPHGVIEYANPTFERISGYSLQEAIGGKTNILKSGLHDEAFYHELWQTISAGKVWKGRFVNRRKDGSLYTEEATISPVFDASGGIVNYIAVKLDISEKLKDAEEKEKLERQCRQAQKMEAIGRLSGGVAHDFNNMLGVIIGHAEIALEKLQTKESTAEDLQGILSAAEKSTEIVRQLLTFARQQPIDPKVVNLNNVIAGMLKLLGRLVGEDINLVWRPEKDLWPVKIDPSQVDQLLTNLCVNARDAISGVGKITIETAVTHIDEEHCLQHKFLVPGEFVVLSVSDNGCGIAGELLQDIFEPFFTTKGLGRGTGLGLATVYGIVKQNRGDIIVDSLPGQGTTFKIYLPRHHAPLSMPRAEKKIERGKRGENVLLVEDDGQLLLVTRRILEQLGYRVLSATTPSEALAIVETGETAIHLLLTDVILPEMNGRELSRQVLTLSVDTKCLYMSGYTADVIARHGVLDPGIAFIEKPFSKKELAKKIRNVLDCS
jgi:two-component system, cell cycle sensor histidine kinase and response regulator CckA